MTGASQVEYLDSVDGIVRELSGRFKVKPAEVVDRVVALQVRQAAPPWPCFLSGGRQSGRGGGKGGGTEHPAHRGRDGNCEDVIDCYGSRGRQ